MEGRRIDDVKSREGGIERRAQRKEGRDSYWWTGEYVREKKGRKEIKRKEETVQLRRLSQGREEGREGEIKREAIYGRQKGGKGKKEIKE